MKLLPWLISLLVHGLIFLKGDVRFHQVTVEVAKGHKGMEVRLTRPLNYPALLKPSPPTPALTNPSHADSQSVAVDSSSHRVLRQSLPKNFSQKKSQGEQVRKNVQPAVPGAAIVERAPDYLSNPAPIYPAAAQERRQQGLVILDVIVSTDGWPETVKIFSGSGYYLLDESAKQAVEKYRFKPALVNKVKVRSHVRVPIRFRLEE